MIRIVRFFRVRSVGLLRSKKANGKSGRLQGGIGLNAQTINVELDRWRREARDQLRRNGIPELTMSPSTPNRSHKSVNQNQTESKPTDAEQESGKELDGTACSSFCHPTEKCSITEDGKCDALREVARSVAGHIRKPYSAGQIAAIIESGDYSAEMMMQHLLILATKPALNGGPARRRLDKLVSETELPEKYE